MLQECVEDICVGSAPLSYQDPDFLWRITFFPLTLMLVDGESRDFPQQVLK